ncbi:MAG TPA: hypothetical protein VGJ84_05280 [Polyangiaceae bacterium]|jgi:hypothetical protein
MAEEKRNLGAGTQAPPNLGAAAADMESEIERFEGLTSALSKIELNSEKSLLRASRTLNEAMAAHQRIADRLPALAAAFAATQKRQQQAAELLQSCAEQLQKRTATFASLAKGLAALGDEALRVTELLKSVTDGESAPFSGNGGSEIPGGLNAVIQRMDAAVEQARQLHRRALEDGIADLARQADSVYQQLAAARAKLRLSD